MSDNNPDGMVVFASFDRVSNTMTAPAGFILIRDCVVCGPVMGPTVGLCPTCRVSVMAEPADQEPT